MRAAPPRPPPSHVVVVGGGIVGASAAYHLTRLPNAPAVTLLEAAPTIAPAASGKAGGFLAADWAAGPMAAMAAAGFALHETLAEDLGGAAAVGYRRLDAYAASFTLGDEARGIERGKAAPSWLRPGAARVRRLATAATAAQVHPRLLTEALIGAAIAAGATVRTGAPVAGLERSPDGRVAGATLASGEAVAADAVLLATGPWTGSIGATWAPGAPAVAGSRAHSVVLAPARGAAVGAHAVFASIPRPGRPAAEPELYPRPDGTVYVCGEGDDAPLPGAGRDAPPDAAACGHLRDAAAAACHALGDGATVLAQQACFLPVTRDGLPVVGEVGGGLFVAAGHGCWGILCGPITGQAIAELMVEGEARCLDLAPFAPRV